LQSAAMSFLGERKGSRERERGRKRKGDREGRRKREREGDREERREREDTLLPLLRDTFFDKPASPPLIKGKNVTLSFSS
jgi:hypothetical protein